MKLKNKFFGLFQVFHLVKKQAYKLELSTKWKIHNIFHMLLLEQHTTRKGRVNRKALPEPEKELEFEVGDNKKYEIEAIIDSAIYYQQANNNQMPGLYYLILWKGYPKEENT